MPEQVFAISTKSHANWLKTPKDLGEKVGILKKIK
jgi:hypothetical protein